MRKVLLTMLAALVMSGGAALAQSSWAGVSLGWPLLQGYYGMEDTLGEGLDLRARAAITPLFGVGFAVGADVLYDVTEFGEADEFDVYVGGGPSLGYLTVGGFGGGFTFDLTGLAGIEYAINQDTGLFAETRLGFGYVSILGYGGFGPAFGGALGVNFYF